MLDSVIERLERHQIACYLGAIAAGGAAGLLIPEAATLAVLIEPVLGLLLFVTFLGIPFRDIVRGFRHGRFFVTLGIVNFVLAPIIVWLLSRTIAANDAVLLGVLLVLLTPCVDYVIVFTRIAGGAADRLLAAAPLLMLAQLILLPGYLFVMAPSETVALIEIEPFARAFALLIVLPLIGAILVQLTARRSVRIQRFERAASGTMVPLIMLTLAVVIASQVRAVRDQLADLLPAAALFVAFVVVMTLVGIVVVRRADLDPAAGRAITFSGVTRNSLVVLPLALALPADFSLAPIVVVTQTLIELVAMLVLVRIVPRLIPVRQSR